MILYDELDEQARILREMAKEKKQREAARKQAKQEIKASLKYLWSNIKIYINGHA